MSDTGSDDFPVDAVQSALEEAREPIRSARQDYFIKTRKLFLGGNAGGLVASLSLTSGYVSPATVEPLPLSLFGLVICFALGLGCSAVALLLEPARLVREEERRVLKELSRRVTPVHAGWAKSLTESYPIDSRASLKVRMERLAFAGACILLALGSTASAVVLYGFTES